MAKPQPVPPASTSFSPRPDYRITITPAGRRLRVEFGGEVLADSDRALVLEETRHAPTYYVPRDDVRMDLLKRTEHRTYCPFKGNASYWTVAAGERMAENAAWSYEEPYAEPRAIAGHIAFYWDRMDGWYEDGEPLFAPVDAGGGANPLAAWLLYEAWEAATSRELVRRFAHSLNRMGMSVLRINVVIRTLHPLLAANSYRWHRHGDAVERFDATYETVTSPQFVDSPLEVIFAGAGGIRRWIGSDTPEDFAILGDLKTEGATDYVAMPLRFSDGQINAFTIATDAPDGFSTTDLGHVHEALPLLSRLFEVHAKERTAATLIHTFLGPRTGERVLDGLVKRGDGEDIHAVIWFSDLRDSTPLAESMTRDGYLDYLNRYFDCTAGAVVDNGGEVLRFMGDAVLAIFPTGEGGGEHGPAGGRAIAAAREALSRAAEANRALASEGRPPMVFGIGLHVGNVTYGNIGIPERLEFTVIGAAANTASRIQDLSRTLGVPVILSDAFAGVHGGDLMSLGRHRLKGVGGEHEVFTLPDN
jgi:adenylate cyclase